MDDLIAFINARLDEDKQTALAACGPEYGRRSNWATLGGIVIDAEDDEWAIMSDTTSEIAAHVARHDPGRELREVAAKRAIVERYQRGKSGDLPEWTAGRELIMAALAILEGVLRDLATEWSDHPDYRQEWKP